MPAATVEKRSATPDPQLYVVQELAALLQCSVRTIWNLNDRGQLPGMVRFGRLIRWRRSEIDAWIARGCR
jgi:excisionase family DNA binding protein